MSIAIVIVFGRPGAGKSTVSEKALELYNSHEVESLEPTTSPTSTLHCLDLDVCVPQWMKDNFAQGIYPTLDQRIEFAVGACNHVDEMLKSMQPLDKAIISFSFVNTDLRNVFRSRFPDAKWVLVDTDDTEAQNRINQREGHFYKGAPPAEVAKDVKLEADNSEWNFAKVEFDHVVLDGSQSVDANAKQVLEIFDASCVITTQSNS